RRAGIETVGRVFSATSTPLPLPFSLPIPLVAASVVTRSEAWTGGFLSRCLLRMVYGSGMDSL
ncbi:hypothetical protein IscW_ISCW014109, partial [Ixodes scapularis]